MTSVVNINKTKKYNVYIGRGSKWGNPFKIGKDGTREEVIKKYRSYLLNDKYLISCLPEIKNKVLGCYCKPLPCHGDILIEICDKEI